MCSANHYQTSNRTQPKAKQLIPRNSDFSQSSSSKSSEVAAVSLRSGAPAAQKDRRSVSNYVAIKRIIRRMRGGSQPYLVQGSDDLFYVAKFAGNPQGTRTLINEWITGRLLETLGVSTPPVRILSLDHTVSEEEEFCFLTGSKKQRITARLHFGSQCPVNPLETMIMDFITQPMLPKVANLQEFAFLFAADQWLGQTDRRQAIFIRERKGSPAFLRAYFIDQGMCLGGNHWAFYDSPLYGRYVNHSIYDQLNMSAECSQAVSQIQQLSEDAIYAAAAMLPPEWFAEGDHAALAQLLSALEKRRRSLPYLVQQAIQSLSTKNQSAA